MIIDFISIDHPDVRKYIENDKKLNINTVPCILIMKDNGIIEKFEGEKSFELCKILIKEKEKLEDKKKPKKISFNYDKKIQSRIQPQQIKSQQMPPQQIKSQQMPPQQVQQPIQSRMPPQQVQQPIQSRMPPQQDQQPIQLRMPPQQIQQPIQSRMQPQQIQQPIQSRMPPQQIQQPIQSIMPQQQDQQPTKKRQRNNKETAKPGNEKTVTNNRETTKQKTKIGRENQNTCGNKVLLRYGFEKIVSAMRTMNSSVFHIFLDTNERLPPIKWFLTKGTFFISFFFGRRKITKKTPQKRILRHSSKTFDEKD